MTSRLIASGVLAFALGGPGVPMAHAHHGPPHDEIDEFDSPSARLVVPATSGGVSWPAVAVSVAGVVAVVGASRRWGLDARVPAPARARR